MRRAWNGVAAVAAGAAAWDARVRDRRRRGPAWQRRSGRLVIVALVGFTALLLVNTACMQIESRRQHAASRSFLAALYGAHGVGVVPSGAALMKSCLMILHDSGGVLGWITAANERLATQLGILDDTRTGAQVRAACLRIPGRAAVAT
ncbi:MAG: hypothetical protein JO209_03615 [Acidisphaera sp.]|nr:hypothetical protein [Acidisphaera sp.]